MFQPYLRDFLHFGFKQAYAALFGGAMLAAILITAYVWPQNTFITRYDFLFLYALFIQAAFLLLKFETWEEAKVIFVFHIVGTAMEVFKTHAGSWIYPEQSLFHIGGVPLFSGFMYSAVGSYIARVWRIFKFEFTHYPPKNQTILLAAIIYINFFSHHFMWDFRYALFAYAAWLFWRTRIYFTPNRKEYWMPLLAGFFLVAFFIWLAENIGTFAAVWRYPHQQDGWNMVSIAKLGSWYLLMLISFVLVTWVHNSDMKEKR